MVALLLQMWLGTSNMVQGRGLPSSVAAASSTRDTNINLRTFSANWTMTSWAVLGQFGPSEIRQALEEPTIVMPPSCVLSQWQVAALIRENSRTPEQQTTQLVGWNPLGCRNYVLHVDGSSLGNPGDRLWCGYP